MATLAYVDQVMKADIGEATDVIPDHRNVLRPDVVTNPAGSQAAIVLDAAPATQDGFVKVLIDEDIGEVLGVHILHSEATELIAEAGIIRSHEGIAASVVDTIHAHPTLSGSVMEAMAAALGRPINT